MILHQNILDNLTEIYLIGYKYRRISLIMHIIIEKHIYSVLFECVFCLQIEG